MKKCLAITFSIQYRDSAFESRDIGLPCKIMFLFRKFETHARLFLLKSQFRIKSRTVGARNDDVEFYIYSVHRSFESPIVALSRNSWQERERGEREEEGWRRVAFLGRKLYANLARQLRV